MAENTTNLEEALRRAESAAEGVVRALAAASREAKKAKSAAAVGHLKDLARAIGLAREAAATAAGAASGLEAAWTFDDRAYLESGAYTAELQAAAAAAGLTMIEQDGRLLTYPSVVKVVAGDAALEIDRQRMRRLRPSAVVAQLRAAQQKPPRFRAEQFIESLRAAYVLLIGRDGKKPGATVTLLDVYGVLTLMPGTAREYAKPEFARDVYLLDRSEVNRTRDGWRLRLPAATGTKTSSTLATVTPEGQLKVYYGIAFES